MNQLGSLVPFAVFTEYRDRRRRGGDIDRMMPDVNAPAPLGAAAGSGAAAAAGEESGCVETSLTPGETTIRAEPTIERIPS
jgi:hypothetical protein